MFKINRKISFAMVFIMMLCTIFITGTSNAVYAAGTTFYVSTTGNDTTGNGSTGSPWRTINKACTTVVASQGNTISIAAGTYSESKLTVPAGTNLIGAGSSSTTINSTLYHTRTGVYDYGLDYFAINLNGSQTIQGFKLDGNNGQVYGGILSLNKDNIIMNDIRVERTNLCAIWLWTSSNSEIKNCYTIDSSYGATEYCYGAIMIGGLTNCSIHDNNISEYKFQAGDKVGYGIKALGPAKYTPITNTKIYNNIINVDPYGEWNNGQAPNFTMELWGVTHQNIDIYNNTLNNNVSLVSDDIESSVSTRLHNNRINCTTGYGVEAEVRNLEVDHNFITGGAYPIANWAGLGSTNMKIHHNVFENNYYDIVRFQQGNASNLQFYNNTIVTNQACDGIYFAAAGSNGNNNIYMRNNIFYTTVASNISRQESGATVTGLVVQNNCLYNFSEAGVTGTYSNNKLSTNPLLNFSGSKPVTYFEPALGSPVIDAGTNVGFAYLGSAPDMGAYEYGGPATASGIVGSYYDYDNGALTPVTVRTDANIDFNWGTSAPPNTVIDDDQYRIIWEGYVQPEYSQTYTFYITGPSNGGTLWVNGQQVATTTSANSEVSGTIALTTGTKYTIKFDVENYYGLGLAQLSWSSTSRSKQVIPQSALSTAP